MKPAKRPWLDSLQARISQPPRTPRAGLSVAGHTIGSVEAHGFATFVVRAGLAPWVQSNTDASSGEACWALLGQPDLALANVAAAMREHGYARVAHLWRDELLAVRDAQGRQIGAVERGAVRALGITTHGVHLTGRTADHDTWIQQRALNKKTDPGRWDTLMGGMVSAEDSLEAALARETLEEAGLELAQLRDLRRVGHFTMRLPNAVDNGLEYVIERIDWFECVVPDDVVPVNTDGEVQQFRRVALGELEQMLAQQAFTIEAALILARQLR